MHSRNILCRPIDKQDPFDRGQGRQAYPFIMPRSKRRTCANVSALKRQVIKSSSREVRVYTVTLR